MYWCVNRTTLTIPIMEWCLMSYNNIYIFPYIYKYIQTKLQTVKNSAEALDTVQVA